MATIIAGRFATFDQANVVARRLYDRAFRPTDVSVFFLNPTDQHATRPTGVGKSTNATDKPAGTGAAQGVIAGGVIGLIVGAILFAAVWRLWLVPVVAAMGGAYLGAFMGALRRLRGRQQASQSPTRMHDAGVMLATHVDEATAHTAIEVLREAGAEAIERANGVWEGGEWRDFDAREHPVRPDATIGERAANDPPERRGGPRRTDWL